MHWCGRSYGDRSAPNQGIWEASAGSDSVLTELELAREQGGMDREWFSRWRERFMQRLRASRACGTLGNMGLFGTDGELGRRWAGAARNESGEAGGSLISKHLAAILGV